jgi:hypothetical protein
MTIVASDILRRRVLLGVELIDPVTMKPVSRGVRLKALGLNNGPLVSWSGRFAWLAEDGRWPTRLEFEPGVEPYEAQPFDVPTRTAYPAPLLRFILRPTVAYPFGEGLTVARGRLRDSADAGAAPIAGARVWIRWTDKNGISQPSPPDRLITRTGANGEFAACLRMPADAKPVLNEGMLAAHITIERDGTIRRLSQDLPDGQLLDLPAALAWSDLT